MSDEVKPFVPHAYNPAQQRAAKSYKTNSYEGLSQRELMVRIYQKIINHLYIAKDAQAASDMEQMAEETGKAIHIIDVLREELLGSDALKDPEAAAAAQFLIKSYGEWIVRIVNVLQHKPASEEFDRIIEVIKDVYKAWIPPKDDGGEPVDNVTPITTSTAG